MSQKISPTWLSALPPLNDDFIKKNYPDSLKLVQVMIYHRHGERAPIGRVFANITPKSWDFCEKANFYHYQFRETMRNVLGTYHPGETTPIDLQNENGTVPTDFYKSIRAERVFPSNLPPEKQAGAGGNISYKKIDPKDEYYRMATPETCGWGQLSDPGWNSMRKVGSYLRELYINRLGFLPEARSDLGKSNLYVRTTDYSRTLESVSQVLSGLYPITKNNVNGDSNNSKQINVFVRPAHDENLFFNYHCKAMGKLMREMGKRTSEIFKTEYDELENELFSLPSIGKESKEWIQSAKVIAPIHRVYDTLISMKAHGVEFPKDITPKFVEQLGKQSVIQWLFGSVINRKLQILQVSPIAFEMTNHIAHKVSTNNGKNSGIKTLPYDKSPEMIILSGHDTTVGPLLFLLGHHDPELNRDYKDLIFEWPEYGSAISLELFKGPKYMHFVQKKDQSAEVEPSKVEQKWPKTLPKNLDVDGYYIRAIYNGKPMKIPACRGKGNHLEGMDSSMCTLDAFFRQVGPCIVHPHEYKEMCKIPPKNTE